MPPDLRPERITQNRVIHRITSPVAVGGTAEKMGMKKTASAK
jgi:hypothetical protein